MLYENDKKYIEIYESDLPLHCPMSGKQSWNSHPRVFLNVKKAPTKEITCPYCSTKYKLIHDQN